MELTREVLLPLLLAAIVINTVIIAIVVAVGRMGRARRTPSVVSGVSTGDRVLSTSYVDRTARAAWPIIDGNESDGSDQRDQSDQEVSAMPLETSADAEEPTDASSIEPDDLRDPLTGLIGSSAFMRLIVDEDGRMQRYHRPATVAIFELEGLDRLTERLGTDASDRVIPAVADTIARLARGADHVARLGPGRFGVLMPETDEVAAINYIERVRRACELWLESGAIALRLVIGWAGTTGDPSLPDAQRIALDRMYIELRRHARASDAAGVPVTNPERGRDGSPARA